MVGTKSPLNPGRPIFRVVRGAIVLPPRRPASLKIGLQIQIPPIPPLVRPPVPAYWGGGGGATSCHI